MDKSTWIKIVLVAVVVVIASVVFITYLDTDESNTDPNVNTGLRSTGSFDLIDENTGTFTNGSFFVIDEDGQSIIKVVANVHVGSEDIGGVAFDMPPELNVTDVLCNYQGDISTDCIAVWTTASDLSYTTSVEIARVSSGHPAGGGDGQVIITTQISDKIDSDTTSIRIGLGSIQHDGGTTIIHPTYEIITIPLKTPTP